MFNTFLLSLLKETHKRNKFKVMSEQEKGILINSIIGVLKNQAFLQGKHFDGGDIFFSLAFKSDKELKQIKNLCGL